MCNSLLGCFLRLSRRSTKLRVATEAAELLDKFLKFITCICKIFILLSRCEIDLSQLLLQSAPPSRTHRCQFCLFIRTASTTFFLLRRLRFLLPPLNIEFLAKAGFYCRKTNVGVVGPEINHVIEFNLRTLFCKSIRFEVKRSFNHIRYFSYRYKKKDLKNI